MQADDLFEQMNGNVMLFYSEVDLKNKQTFTKNNLSKVIWNLCARN